MHRNSLFRRYKFKHFKTDVDNILRPITKNFPESAVYNQVPKILSFPPSYIPDRYPYGKISTKIYD